MNNIDKIREANARIADLEARLDAIDAALEDADAPEATEAKALDDDPIIERVKLWKHVQDELAEQLGAANARADAATGLQYLIFVNDAKEPVAGFAFRDHATLWVNAQRWGSLKPEIRESDAAALQATPDASAADEGKE